jgi:hypothetical protein
MAVIVIYGAEIAQRTVFPAKNARLFANKGESYFTRGFKLRV